MRIPQNRSVVSCNFQFEYVRRIPHWLIGEMRYTYHALCAGRDASHDTRTRTPARRYRRNFYFLRGNRARTRRRVTHARRTIEQQFTIIHDTLKQSRIGDGFFVVLSFAQLVR